MTKVFSTTLNRTDKAKIHEIGINGSQKVDVVPPPMMADHEGTTSPHHLFLASVGGCVNLIFEIALERARLELMDLESTIMGNYETEEDTQRSYFSSIELETTVTVPEGTSESKLERLFNVAQENCPIGNCLIGSCVKLITRLNVVFG